MKEGRDARKIRYRSDPVKHVHERARHLLGEIRKRAKANNLDFDITLENFRSLYNGSVTHCPILGIALNYTAIDKYGDDSASIDRIIPSKGYVMSNIAIVSYKANRIKNNGTADEHRKIANWIDAQPSS